MQNSSSKFTQILLILILLALLFFIVKPWLFKNNELPLEQESETPQASDDKKLIENNQKSTVLQTQDQQVNIDNLSTYSSTKLGISFQYPKIWGTVVENFYPTSLQGFDYKLSFTDNNMVGMVGLSHPYEHEGRDGYTADLTKSDLMLSTCENTTSESVISSDGHEGLYVYGTVIAGMGDCFDYFPKHYGIFDVNNKIKNFVITANPNTIQKSDILTIMKSFSSL